MKDIGYNVDILATKYKKLYRLAMGLLGEVLPNTFSLWLNIVNYAVPHQKVT